MMFQGIKELVELGVERLISVKNIIFYSRGVN